MGEVRGRRSSSSRRVSRRAFLKRSAGLGAGVLSFPYVVPSSALGRGERVAPSNRITMGCIGVGMQGTGNMRAFMGNPDVQVVAVCDVDAGSNDYWAGVLAGSEPARRMAEDYYGTEKRTYRGCDSYGDFRELLAREDIDAVTVCTPDHWHGTIAVAAARAGKDIYCEKPLVNTVAEGRAVCGAVERYERVLQTGSHERSTDTVRFACELVRNGRIGKLHTIRVNMPNSDPHHELLRKSLDQQPAMPVPRSLDYDMWLGPTPWVPYTRMRCHGWWRFIFDHGGGEMTDRGAHIIDLAQLANGTDHTGPIEIKARGTAPPDGLFNAFLDYDFDCVYANGVRMIGGTDQPRGLKFEGSDGWIFIHIHGGRLEADPASVLRESIGPGEVHLGRSRGHHRDFLDAVKSRGQPVAPAEVGHRTATICHLLNIGMLLGRDLKWDPEKEEVVNDVQANRMLSRPFRDPWRV